MNGELGKRMKELEYHIYDRSQVMIFRYFEEWLREIKKEFPLELVAELSRCKECDSPHYLSQTRRSESLKDYQKDIVDPIKAKEWFEKWFGTLTGETTEKEVKNNGK